MTEARITYQGQALTNFAQYCQVEHDAGGIFSSARDFVRASRLVLSAQGKSRARREWRRCWLAALWNKRLETQAQFIQARF